MSTHPLSRWFATAALLTALPLAAQGIGAPPSREAARAPAPAPLVANFPTRVLDGAVLEAGPVAMPIAIQPDSGLGVPGVVVGDVPEKKIIHEKIPYAPFEPQGFAPTVAHEDLEADAQPLMQDWEGIGPNGLNPPDPDVAAGYDYVMEVTNDDFAVYDRCGNEVFRRDANDYFGISSTQYLLFDPKVFFDPWNGRWVMMWHKTRQANQESTLLLAMTSNATPFGLTGADAYWYDFNVVQNAGTADASWADYFDVGYSNTMVFASGNMFRFSGGFRWARHIVWNKAQIYNRVAASFLSFSNLTNADGSTTASPRTPKQQVNWSEGGLNIDATFINSRGGGGDRLTLWKLTGAFGANTLTRNDIAVSAYTAPPDATQPDGRTLDTIDCRLMPAVITNDFLGSNGLELFTSLTTGFTGGVTRTRLFKIDAVSRAVELDSNFGATGWSYWFATPAADYSGSAAWVFCRTGAAAGQECEVRFVDVDQGTFSSSSSAVRAGSGTTSGRWGDYFGAQLDWGDYSANISLPGRPAKMWMVGQFAKANSWGTQIAATSVFAQGSLSSVTPTTTWSITGLRNGTLSSTSRTFTLTNSGAVGLAWEVTGLPSWLTASRTEGQLFPGTTTVTLSTTANANTLAAGTYTANVVFRDCFNGGNTFTRTVDLRIYDLTEVCPRGTNPTTSFDYVSGLPRIGSSLRFSLHNPCGTQRAGSTVPILFFSLGSSNIPLPGFGLCSPFTGYVLVDLGPAAWLDLLIPGPIWNGTPSTVTFSIPNDRGLVGLRLHGQGVLQDPTPRAQVPFGFTCGTTFVIGN